MPAFVADALASHAASFGPTRQDDLLFTSPTGGPLSLSNFRSRCWTPTLRRIGVEPARFHLLRHHAGAAAAEVGVHAAAIRDLMRHSWIRTTFDVYVDHLPSLADDVGHRMERFARGDELISIAAASTS
jgi:integrase